MSRVNYWRQWHSQKVVEKETLDNVIFEDFLLETLKNCLHQFSNIFSYVLWYGNFPKKEVFSSFLYTIIQVYNPTLPLPLLIWGT